MRFYTDKLRLNTAGEMIGARAGAASSVWLMAAQKHGLEGRAGDEEELSLHTRATLGVMLAQGSRERRSAPLLPRAGWGDSVARHALRLVLREASAPA